MPSKSSETRAGCAIVLFEALRVIGNARSEHHTCVMAGSRHGMAEFGALFHIVPELEYSALVHCLNLMDEVRAGHLRCLRCSLKFLAFCIFFCGSRIPLRRACYEYEYEKLIDRFGSGRDFFKEVDEAIRAAKPSMMRGQTRRSRQDRRDRMKSTVFPTDIRFFRGDLDH